MLKNPQVRSKIVLLQARHYFLSVCVLLLWVTIGFFIVTQSQADEWYEEIFTENTLVPVLPMSLRGPTNDTPTLWYPIQKITNDKWLLKSDTRWLIAYDTIMRNSLQQILLDIESRCWTTSQSDTLDHIESYIVDETWILEILDAWCLLESLSPRYDYNDPLIATKLPFIKLLAVHHAWSRRNVTQAVRTLPIETRFIDQPHRWSWSDTIHYAEYHGLLDWVTSDELHPLHGFSKQELYALFGSDAMVWEDVFLHEVMYRRSETQEVRSSPNMILLYHPTNQKILRTVIKRMQRTPTQDQEALLRKLLTWLTQNLDEITVLRKWVNSILR